MYNNIYIPFKSTDSYDILQKKLKQKYNRVRPDDFIYMEKLGEGGFGLVVHCKKKSTGKHYAMKIQTKNGILDFFSDDPFQADFEKQAFAALQHTFIMNLDYAFQSSNLAMMVLGLATGGDLGQVQKTYPDDKMPEDVTAFYIAEIICALGYIHQMGLIYRDLKPANVLVDSDGHVKLIDLGGVLDHKGKLLSVKNRPDLVQPLFGQKYSTKTPDISSNSKESFPKESSVIKSTKLDKIDKLLSVKLEPNAPPDVVEGRKQNIMGTFG